MMFSSDQRWILIGIISYGFTCFNVTLPSLIARVSSYTNWIMSKNITDIITIDENAFTTTTLAASSTGTVDMTTTNSRSSRTDTFFRNQKQNILMTISMLLSISILFHENENT